MWNNTCCSCSIYIQLFCAWRCPSQSASSGIDIPKFSRRFTQQPPFSGSFNLTKSSAPSKEGENFFLGIERGMGSRCSRHQNQSESPLSIGRYASEASSQHHFRRPTQNNVIMLQRGRGRSKNRLSSPSPCLVCYSGV